MNVVIYLFFYIVQGRSWFPTCWFSHGYIVGFRRWICIEQVSIILLGWREITKVKKVLHRTPVREYPIVIFHEDNDMHFSFAPTVVAIERTTEYDHDVEEREEEAEDHDDAQYTDVEFGQVHGNWMGVKRIKGEGR